MPIDELPELLRPAIEKYRDEAEERGRVAGELVDELRERGAFGLLTPPERGGFGAPVAEALDFYARVARIDGPTAWLLWNFNLGFVAGWLPDEAIERIWAGGRAPLTANSGSPGRLTAVDGGYRLTGTWKIVSGAHAAEWYLLAGAEGGFESLRLCAVPRAEVSIQDTWDVVGMRASDSNCVTAEDVFVPAFMTQSLYAPHRTAGLPVINLLFPGCAAVLIGMAEAAIDEMIALAAVKRGFDGILLAEKDHVSIAVGRSLSQVAAARGLLLAQAANLSTTQWTIPGRLALGQPAGWPFV
ncbi:acyl-CoA dehydrogenase family protein [Actinoplanes sp. NPDC049596]|uniref:acyl-CoA dehydrogenase family protein n=1 Tax=unclassified Actinoplanes TaxID=2626549 RepID=UPI003431C4D7